MTETDTDSYQIQENMGSPSGVISQVYSNKINVLKTDLTTTNVLKIDLTTTNCFTSNEPTLE